MTDPTDAGWFVGSYESGRYRIVRDGLGTWYVEWEGRTQDDIQLRDDNGEISRFVSALDALDAAEIWRRSERPMKTDEDRDI